MQLPQILWGCCRSNRSIFFLPLTTPWNTFIMIWTQVILLLDLTYTAFMLPILVGFEVSDVDWGYGETPPPLCRSFLASKGASSILASALLECGGCCWDDPPPPYQYSNVMLACMRLKSRGVFANVEDCGRLIIHMLAHQSRNVLHVAMAGVLLFALVEHCCLHL